MNQLGPNNQYPNNDDPSHLLCEKKVIWSDNQKCKACLSKEDGGHTTIYCDNSCLSKYDSVKKCSPGSAVATTISECDTPCVSKETYSDYIFPKSKQILLLETCGIY